MKLRSTAALFALVLGMSGCSTTVTNLTPNQLPRNAQGVYPFEVALETSQKAVREDTIKPYVIIGLEKYPMQPTPMLKNRWEAVVPIPATTNKIYYRYKFDYTYDRIPKAGEGSRLSPTYQLEIVERFKTQNAR